MHVRISNMDAGIEPAIVEIETAEDLRREMTARRVSLYSWVYHGLISHLRSGIPCNLHPWVLTREKVPECLK